MNAISDVLMRVGPGFFQQAFVVDDMTRAQAACVALGCGAFVTLPATDLDYELRGAAVTSALEIAFARSGNVQIELIRPVRGSSIHVEFLETHGPGAHHLGFLVNDLDRDVAVSAFEKIQGGQFGTLRFCYLDTWDAFGAYVELVEDPDGMMSALMPWR